MAQPENKRSTIYFDKQTHKSLRLKAAETHRSLSDMVNEAVKHALLEDQQDLAAFEARESEPTISYEAVRATNLSLTPALEQFVRDYAESGDYNDASEVIREALRLLKRTEEQRALKLERLRTAIQVGIEDMEQGNHIAISSDKELDNFFAKL